MENVSLPLSRIPCGAAIIRPLLTSTDEQHGGSISCFLTGVDAIRGMIRVASYKISRSLAYVAFYQGDEILAVLPGTIIRADGVVATCASHLRFPTTKELRVTVTVMVQEGPQHWKATCEGALLDADLSSNLAFIKFTPVKQPKVAEVGKASGWEAVAVGCISRDPGLDDTEFTYLPAYLGSLPSEILNEPSNEWTPGQDISANVQGDDSVIGGPLVQPACGLVGVVHYANGRHIKATPIDEVLKCLERLEKSLLHPRSFLLGIPCGAAIIRPLLTSTDEQDGGPIPCILSRVDAIRGMIRVARYKISHALAYVAFYQGDEILAVLPGTIIRSDGVVATCASHLRFPTTKELRVTVTVTVQKGPQHWKVTCEGGLLNADLSSNLAFIKFTPVEQPMVAEVGKASGFEGVAVGCISRDPGLDDTEFKYLPAYIGSLPSETLNEASNEWTPGQDISADVQGDDSVIGGPLVQPACGLVGVIHYANGRQIKATPIDEVLKCLERLEKRVFDVHH